MEKKYWSVQRLAVFGVMSALVFTSSWMQIPIGDVSRVPLGNGFCALTGLLFGPWVGGLASGVGSMLFDFTNPMYIAESWITFLTKFAIGFITFITFFTSITSITSITFITFITFFTIIYNGYNIIIYNGFIIRI